MKLEQYINILTELAKDVEVGDPFDWADVAIDEDAAYRLMAMNVAEMDEDALILKATIVKLLVENMVLNIRLLQNASST